MEHKFKNYKRYVDILGTRYIFIWHEKEADVQPLVFFNLDDNTYEYRTLTGCYYTISRTNLDILTIPEYLKEITLFKIKEFIQAIRGAKETNG